MASASSCLLLAHREREREQKLPPSIARALSPLQLSQDSVARDRERWREGKHPSAAALLFGKGEVVKKLGHPIAADLKSHNQNTSRSCVAAGERDLERERERERERGDRVRCV